MPVRRAQLSMLRTSLEKWTWAVEEGGVCMGEDWGAGDMEEGFIGGRRPALYQACMATSRRGDREEGEEGEGVREEAL